MLFVVRVDVNREPPRRVAESTVTVLIKPTGLDHPVCRQGKCQRGVYKDYCGKDSDCLSNNCVGVTDIAKCKN